MYTIKGKYTSALITNDEIEEQCINQINSMINHVAFDNPVVIQVDAHAGKGSVVGFTMPLGTKVIPQTIGVDIGCAVLSANIGDKLPITLKELDDRIRRDIPMGTDTHEKSFKINSNDKFSFDKHFPWDELNNEMLAFIRAYNAKFGTDYLYSKYEYRNFGELCQKIGMKPNRAEMSIGTLGGGNHFIEVSKSSVCGDIWVTIHSGSRNFGKMVCEFHQNIAKDTLNDKRNVKLKDKIEFINKNTQDKTSIPLLTENAKKELGLDFNFDVKGMEFLEDKCAFEYLLDMVVAQKYAQFNRKMMLNIVCQILGGINPVDSIESVHNYIDFRDFIIRKGAIRSYLGEKMIVALNMRDGSLVCEGKSSAEWNYSCGHGAGRKMSRSAAKENLDLDEFRKQMEGIYSTSVVKSTLDEAPYAYKNVDTIERLNFDTATVIDRLVPILNIKDKNSGPSFKERKEEKKRNNERQAARELKQKNY